MRLLNYRNWNGWVFGIVLFLTLCVGAAIGADSPESAQAEPEVRVDTQEVVREVENTDRLNHLREVDDQIMAQSNEVIDAQKTALEVAAAILTNIDTVTMTELDTGTQIINEQTARIKAATVEVEKLKAKREAVLAQ